MIGRLTKAMIENTLYQHEVYKGKQQNGPSKTAVLRRKNEKAREELHPSYIGWYRGHYIEISVAYFEGCARVYYALAVRVDNRRTTTKGLRALIEAPSKKSTKGR